MLLLSPPGSVAQAIPVKSFEIVPQSDMRGISKITITVEADDSFAAAESDGPEIVVETVAQDEIVDAEPEVVVAVDDAVEEEPQATVALDEEIVEAIVAEEAIPEPEVAVAEVELVADEGIPEASELVVAETPEAELIDAEAIIVADVVVEEVAEPMAVQVASAASPEDEVAEIAATEELFEDEAAEIAATEEAVELEESL